MRAGGRLSGRLGLQLGQEPGLYAPDWAADWQHRLPAIVVRDVLGVNHYTILFSEIGAPWRSQRIPSTRENS